MDIIEIIQKQTESLLNKIIETYTLSIEEQDDTFHILIETEEEAAIIIGKHGDTIRAIQKMLEVILYKQTGKSLQLLVDVNDYRIKQKERLEYLALQQANHTRKARVPSFLKGFSAYERKIIHEHIIENCKDLTSYSIGSGRDRRIVINLKTAKAIQEGDQNDGSDAIDER